MTLEQSSLFITCSFHNYFHSHFTKQAGNYNNNLRNDKITQKICGGLTYIQKLVKPGSSNTRHQQHSDKNVIRDYLHPLGEVYTPLWYEHTPPRSHT